MKKQLVNWVVNVDQLTNIKPLPCQVEWGTSELSAELSQALERCKVRFNSEVSKVMQKNKRRPTSEQNAISFVVRRTDINLEAQVATTFPFILLYRNTLVDTGRYS